MLATELQRETSRSHWRGGKKRITCGSPDGLNPMTSDNAILVVEDNEDDVFFLKRSLAAAGVTNPLHVVTSGADAIDFLSGAGRYRDRSRYPLPALVFLDLKLPLMSGHEVLAWIRGQRHLESIVVVVLTSSNEPADLRRAYSLGANSYLVKPLTARQLLDLAKAFAWPWEAKSPPVPVTAQ